MGNIQLTNSLVVWLDQIRIARYNCPLCLAFEGGREGLRFGLVGRSCSVTGGPGGWGPHMLYHDRRPLILLVRRSVYI